MDGNRRILTRVTTFSLYVSRSFASTWTFYGLSALRTGWAESTWMCRWHGTNSSIWGRDQCASAWESERILFAHRTVAASWDMWNAFGGNDG